MVSSRTVIKYLIITATGIVSYGITKEKHMEGYLSVCASTKD